MASNKLVRWDVDKFLVSKYALLILNGPLKNEDQVRKLWTAAKVRFLVDGGANRMSHLLDKFGGDLVLPDVVCGDFDSIHAKLLEEFRKMDDVRVVETPDQDHTDFTKALKVFVDAYPQIGADLLIAYVEPTGRRLDQLFGNIETLYHANQFLPMPVVLMSSETMTFLLDSGTHEIVSSQQNGHIGLIPVGQSARVTTSGLKWNLKDQTLAFGKLVSTSNTYDQASDRVIVSTDKPIIWTMDYS